ncbi:hypothetical protein NMG60_11006436 [Bertholletia excelsa]
MALRASCWLIVESILIPEGFLKWFYLSFYIHPLLLFLCQIFLWVKLLQTWLLIIFSLPIRIMSFLFSTISRFLSSILSSFSFTRSINTDQFTNEAEEPEITQLISQYRIADSYSLQTDGLRKCEIQVLKLQRQEFEVGRNHIQTSCLDDEILEEPSMHIDEDTSSQEYSSSSSSCSFTLTTQDFEDVDMVEFISFISNSTSPTQGGERNTDCSSSLPSAEQELLNTNREEDLDSFYHEYTEKMRWFDLLNQERSCGISAVLNKKLASPCSFESIKSVEPSVPYVFWSKVAQKKLLRSLESDFELVYVAQTCLSWEALHHQYRKVETIACCSTSQRGAFYENVAGRFQKFQILLERFMEDESCEGKRHWNYVHRKLSHMSLLQVPEVSGYSEEGEDESQGEAMRAVELLKGIEKCIKAFWLYVKCDKKRPRWKFRSFMWTRPPVEDPRDLQYLADLNKTLQTKELWLKDLKGKKKCWLRTIVNPLEESQKKEILFTMIEMKLVRRVLKMSIISTSQLKWCQDKLSSIEFREGRVFRGFSTGSLFPSS